jgi:hypothetical protein
MAKGQRTARIDRDGAEALALRALAFLAGEPRRLTRLLDETGLSVADLRAAPDDPTLLAGVLAHLRGDESMLLVFTAETGLTTDDIAAADAVLGGGSPWQSI